MIVARVSSLPSTPPSLSFLALTDTTISLPCSLYVLPYLDFGFRSSSSAFISRDSMLLPSPARFLLLGLFLLSALPSFAEPQPSYLASPLAKASHLLHCLGHGPSARADRAKVQALIEAYPNISDDNAWSQLSPREWGFKGHNTPGSNTWTLENVPSKTAKERLIRQHQKLMRCANNLQQEVAAMEEGVMKEHVQEIGSGKQVQEESNRRVLPDMFGGVGFRQVRQDGREGFFLRKPKMVLAKNDATAISPGPTSPSNDPSPATTTREQKDNVQNPTTPGDGQKSASDGKPSLATAKKANTGSLPSVDGHKGSPGSAMTAAGQKSPPGLGPDVKSVAPALESDPSNKNMPGPAPVDGAAGAGLSDDHAVNATETKPLITAQRGSTMPGSTPADGSTIPRLGSGTQSDIATSPDQSDTSFTPPPASQSQSSTPGRNKFGVPDTLSSPFDTTTVGAGPLTGCTKPRIRKEYSTLTREEKKAYVDAIKCVRAQPSRFGPQYNAMDDWTLLHIRMVKYVHFTAYFTLFHRGFTAIVERDLNQCGFPLGLPWVDWTKTAQDPSTNAVFDGDQEYGLGTNGQGDADDCPWGTGLAVTDGALADQYFNAPFRHRLCRQFNNLDVNTPSPHFGSNCTTFISPAFIKGLGNTHDKGRFFDFSSALEISSHLSMHTCIGGGIAWLSTSPNEYVFHNHHGFVDNVFDAWQKKSQENRRAFHGPKQQQKNGKHPPWEATLQDEINFRPLAENVKVVDLLDPESGKWGGRMCYRYDYNLEM